MSSHADRSWVGSMPEAYDRFLGPVVFRPFAVDLARRAAALRPRRVLELAAGTGELTRALVDVLTEAEVTATDLNEAMVRHGSRRVPEAAWQPADALGLPFPADRFDLVVCQFGVMFFPDKARAFGEVRRVLAPAGRLLFNAWDVLATHDFEVALMAGLERAFPADPPMFIATIPHGYADLERIADDLAAGGLECVAAESVTREGRAPSTADLATGYCTGTPLRAEIEARGDLDRATRIVAEEMTARLGEGPVTASMRAHVVEARALD